MKVTVKMTAYHRAKLEITVEDLKERLDEILMSRWQKLISIQEELINFLKAKEADVRS